MSCRAETLTHVKCDISMRVYSILYTRVRIACDLLCRVDIGFKYTSCRNIVMHEVILTAIFSVHLTCSSLRAVVSFEARFNRAAVCAIFRVNSSFSATLWSYCACSSAIWTRNKSWINLYSLDPRLAHGHSSAIQLLWWNSSKPVLPHQLTWLACHAALPWLHPVPFGQRQVYNKQLERLSQSKYKQLEREVVQLRFSGTSLDFR